jgi:hypothetical protein
MLIILLSGWHAALHLMHHGYWCTAAGRGRLACTPGGPRGVLIRVVPFREMTRLIRHGYECTAGGRGRWSCAPNLIRR